MMRLSDLIPDLDCVGVLPPRLPAVGDARSVRVARVTADSRLVQPGTLFVAVRGTRVDGHRYVADAVRSGAVAVVVESGGDGVDAAGPVWQLVVNNSRAALAHAAAALAGHPSRRLTAIGITGTNGKTTVAILARSILEAAGRRPGLIGTIRYEIGARSIPAPLTTPDSVMLQNLLADMVEAGLDSVVMEVSSHALDQRRTEGMAFDVGVFTHLTPDHGDYHPTRADYARAKRRLFEGLPASAAAVLNRADPVSEAFASHTEARPVWFGLGGDVSATVHEMTLVGSHFTLDLGGERVPVRTRLVGKHNVDNAVAAAAAGWALGLPAEAIKAGIEAVEVIPGRLERVAAGQNFEILVDYAHTDDALLKVLESVRPLVAGRLIVVFGAGGNRDRAKRPRMGAAAALTADSVWITSDNPRNEDPTAIIAAIAAGVPARARATIHQDVDRLRAIHAAIAEAGPGDAVVIAGKGHERTQKFADVEIPFDDAQVARAAVEAVSRPHAAAG